MRDYSQYEMADFATDIQFQDWVLDGNGQKYWERVIRDFPQKREDIEKAKSILLSIDFEERKPESEVIDAYLKKTLEIIGRTRTPKIFLLRRWGGVAAAIVLLIFGYWFARFNQTKGDEPMANTPQIIGDIAPGKEKAVLTFADGTEIFLDSSENGRLGNQGNVAIIKSDNGHLSYNKESGRTSEALYNTITIPVGGTYQLELSDGTKVWLNAKSSLHFPVNFEGRERKVELKGEGYFEVAADMSNPFIVSIAGMEVKVLGTHFNIKGYDDEPGIQTTLFEGKVELSNTIGKVKLEPMEQANLDFKEQRFIKTGKVDENKVMAWKNGEFVFEETDLKEVLRTLSRWYNFDIDYSQDMKQIFIYGSISRNKNLSEVLKILEVSGIQFRMERVGNNNRLVVLK